MDEDEGHYPLTGPTPTAVVNSSANRRHLYWRLTEPVSTEFAVGLNRRMAVWAGADRGKAGLASVLRVPGTLNYKRSPQIDTVSAVITEGQWEPAVLDQAIPQLPDQDGRPTDPTEGTYDGPAVRLASYLRSDSLIVYGEVPDHRGTKFAVLCPWHDEHTGGDNSGTYVGQRAGGGTWFHCNHSHCEGRTWREFRQRIRPVHLVHIVRKSSDNPQHAVRITRG
jgi:hypothetical protein